MRNTLILIILVSIGLTVPALAGERHGEKRYRSDHKKVERDHRDYAKHDRNHKYDRFQKRMKKLRKNLRHERKENRRLERRDARRSHKYSRRHDYRRPYRAPVVVAPRRQHRPMFFPTIVVRIPFNW